MLAKKNTGRAGMLNPLARTNLQPMQAKGRAGRIGLLAHSQN